MATLYRKYRSKTFDEVIGQGPIVTTLTNQVKMGRVSHAYLFTGSRGTGKTSCARIFARAVNCLNPVNGSPCGKCEACKKLDSPDNVDIIEMDAASNNGVDDARDIREKVKYLPTSCKYKVYIIDEVHMLTGGAFNALLKTIEEPPEHVIFILATTEPQKLPQTILSRCIRFDFRLVETDLIAAHIMKIYDAEGVKYTEDAVKEIARQGEGSVRDALSVADTLMSAADVITTDVVLSLTGAGDSAAIGELFDCVASRNVAGALERIDGFAKRGKSMAAVAHQLTAYARNVIVVKSAPSAEEKGLLNVDKATAQRIKASASFPMRDVASILEGIAAAENGLKYSVNPRVFLETALIKLMCAFDVTAELTRRIAAIESKLSAQSAEQKKNNVNSSESEPPPAPKKPQDVIYTPKKNSSEPVKPAPVNPPEAEEKKSEAKKPPVSDEYYPPADAYEPPPDPYYAAPREVAAPKNREVPSERASAREVKQSDVTSQSGTVADEGEFMQYSAQVATGVTLYGKILRHLRKKGTYASARAKELISREGVTVKEREDAIAFVAPDEVFFSLSEPDVKRELDEAVKAAGTEKPARPERTEEDLYLDDLDKMRVLFGRDCVTPRS
ncbi:MAG: DNA polymerase III subunit gamma/tau [Clostridiales bacterium]|nr:DNA polymerase III subunit gamma/tau [Clostridiales bacterium]